MKVIGRTRANQQVSKKAKKKRRKSTTTSRPEAVRRRGSPQPANLDAVWSRSGAATVAGVTYQVRVTAQLLVAGWAEEVPIVAVPPEGEEDIDCTLLDGRKWFVQAKDRRAGQQLITRSLVRDVVEHAAANIGDGSEDRIVLVTNAAPNGDLQPSGWFQTLGESLPGGEVKAIVELAKATSPTRLRDLLDRTHLVLAPWSTTRAVEMLRKRAELPPVVADLVHAKLLEDLSQVASDQRFRTRKNAISRLASDVDNVIRTTLEAIDVKQLDLALRDGIIEPIDFLDVAALEPERFLAGVDANPGHIAANLDLPRVRELEDIYSGLREDSFALLLGPSGSGKSTLLWRAAHDFPGAVRRYRLSRLQVDQTDELLRWLRLQRPTPNSPILLCADNLGQPATAGWTMVARRILEMPGVLLLGAVRYEDFEPGIAAGRARIVEPAMDQALAESIATTLDHRGISTILDPIEAYRESSGLLMEFLSLLVSGKRIDEVITAQALARLDSGRTTEREVLRYVCAAHQLGLSIPATSLPELVGSTSDCPPALRALARELLITSEDNEHWRGLHELRSSIVTRRIHELPPPTEGGTYGVLFQHLSRSDGAAIVARYSTVPHANLEPLLEQATLRLANENLSAPEFADLVESFAVADSNEYAKSCLAYLPRPVPAPLTAVDALNLAYLVRHRGFELPFAAPYVSALATGLPELGTAWTRRLLDGVPTTRLSELLASAPIADAIRLCESIEVEGPVLTATDVRMVVESQKTSEAGLMSRLLPSLFALMKLDTKDVETCFGPIEERLATIVTAQANGIGYSLTSADDGTVATVRMLIPAGESDAHDQAVSCGRHIFGLCPEVDVAEIITLLPDGSRYEVKGWEPAYKRLGRESLPRSTENHAPLLFMNAVVRLSTSNYWTEALRSLAEAAQRAIHLLNEVPDRVLNPDDNPRRRRNWIDDVHAFQRLVASLPIPPRGDPSYEAKDPGKLAMEALGVALRQLSDRLEQTESVRLALVGANIRRAIPLLQEARKTDYPALSSGGDLFPDDLDGSAAEIADLLIGVENEGFQGSPKQRASSWRKYGQQCVQLARTAVIADERRILTSLFGNGDDVTILLTKRPRHDSLELVTESWVVLLQPDSTDLIQRILSVPADSRPRLAFRTFVVPVVVKFAVPPAAVQLGSESIFPVEEEQMIELCSELDLIYPKTVHTAQIGAFLDALFEASRTSALCSLREPSLSSVDSRVKENEARAALDSTASVVADVELREMCQRLVHAFETESDPGDIASSLLGSAMGRTSNGISTEASDLVLAACRRSILDLVDEASDLPTASSAPKECGQERA